MGIKFNTVVNNVKKILMKKVSEPAKELVIKEQKTKRKKLRRKWRKILNDHNIKKLWKWKEN
jgi:hypothetical protein